MSLLDGRRGLVVGIANERSIATGIARAARAEGAHLVVTYQNERLSRWVQPIADELGAELTVPCDLTDDAQLQRLAQSIEEHWGRLDFMVHSVAHAVREDLGGRLVDTSRAGFASALDVSVYSLLALARALEPQLIRGSAPSIVTASYLGAQRVVPGYGVMGLAKAALESAVRYLAHELGPEGIRVNALSPGPVKTLSAAGIPGFRQMLSHVASQAPLGRSIGVDELGRAALFLLSELGSGITGETIFVDGGYHLLAGPTQSSTS